MMNTGNPALKEDTFDLGYDVQDASARRSVMTLQGTVLKSATLVGITVVAATVTWGMVQSGGMGVAMPWMIGGALVGFLLALVTIFKPKASPFTAPLYAVAEGLFLGAISAVFAAMVSNPNTVGDPWSNIVVQAVGLTLAVLATMLGLYYFRIIKVTAKLRAGIVAATGAVFLFYLATIVINLIFGASTMPWLHSSGPIGIGISLVIIGVAAFNLLLDFDLIEKGVQQRAPKYMEWYAGFALLVTLVWLYLEILRLLAKIRSE